MVGSNDDMPDEGQEISDDVLYVHVYEDGNIYLLPSDTPCGIHGDVSRLKAELVRIKDLGGHVRYTTDPVDAEAPEFVMNVLELIESYEVYFYPIDYPHPEVYGYDRSYVPYIIDAAAVAEMDIEGIERILFELNEFLEKTAAGTSEHREALESRDEFSRRLTQARSALASLERLQLELCTEIEGENH